ncbi:MAG: pantoate--beta-alanine ligase, partial [Pseudomonadota bacterium]
MRTRNSMINRQNCPIILKDITSLDLSLAPWREDKEKIALVPTMGSLHEGHLSLIRLAKEHAHHVVVSIFVNPRQFGPSEDFATYPRDEQADIEKVAQAGGDVAYIPEVEVMYTPCYQTNISLPPLSKCLDCLS